LTCLSNDTRGYELEWFRPQLDVHAVLQLLLSTITSWDFNIFSLDTLTYG
jgi:hypothetical protein